MNAVTKAAGAGLPSLASLKENLVHTASAISAGGSGDILRMLRTGKWVYGQQNIEVEDGSRWAVNPFTMKKGFVAWTDRKGASNTPLAERMVPMSEALPVDLPDVFDEKNGGAKCAWTETYYIDMVCVSGEDIRTEVVYKPSSYGGKAAVQELLNAIIQRIDVVGESGAEIVPVLELGNTSYNHKTYGETYNPILEIKSWTTLEGTASVADAEPEQTDLIEEVQRQEAQEQHVTTRRRRRA